MKYVYLAVTWIVELFAFLQWFHCWLFKDSFYFTHDNLTATLTNALNDDKGMPLLLVRAFHNKVFLLPWELGQTLLQYWDIRFLADFIGVVGAVGVLLALWYLVTKERKNVVGWGLVGLGIVLPLIEMYFVPHFMFEWRLTALGAVFQLLSLFGVFYFLQGSQKKWRYTALSVLIVISVLLLFTLPLSYQMFCFKM